LLSRNHELSAFACVCLSASLTGVPPTGALLLGLLGAWAGDWPDIDHAGATATRSLRWIPYWRRHPRDKKTGDYKRRKDGRLAVKVLWFPSHQVHTFFCWLSGWIWDRCATPLDRADRNKLWGPAFRVHRGFTHSVWCAGLVGLVWWAALAPWDVWTPLAPIFGAAPVPVLVGEAVALGMVAHIVGDGCTDFGVAPLAPVWKWRGRRYVRMGLWEPLRFKVSKSVETLLVAPVCGALVAYSVAGAFLGPQHVVSSLWAFGTDLWSRLA
jgi:membrane-bound metal-dependent hydrolase YbcI (DUF457 family)